MSLTEADIDTIERIVDERMEFKFPNLSAKIDKILKIVSDFAGQLKGTQDEQTVQSGQISRLEDRTKTLEKLHPDNQHSSLV